MSIIVQAPKPEAFLPHWGDHIPVGEVFMRILSYYIDMAQRPGSFDMVTTGLVISGIFSPKVFVEVGQLGQVVASTFPKTVRILKAPADQKMDDESSLCLGMISVFTYRSMLLNKNWRAGHSKFHASPKFFWDELQSNDVHKRIPEAVEAFNSRWVSANTLGEVIIKDRELLGTLTKSQRQAFYLLHLGAMMKGLSTADRLAMSGHALV